MVSSAYGMCWGTTEGDPEFTRGNSPVCALFGGCSATGGHTGGAAGAGIDGGVETGTAETGTAEIGVWVAGGGGGMS
jgi:hypothetical protein